MIYKLRVLLGGLIWLAGASTAFGQIVTLPLDHYDALRARAYPTPPGEVSPAVGISFESVDLDLAVAEGHARVSVLASLWLHGEGWQSVPWPADLPVLSARSSSAETRVAVVGAERRLELRGKPGRHRVEIESSVAVTADANATRATAALAVTLPAAARVSGTLSADSTVAEVAGEGAVRVAVAGPGRWRFAGEPGQVAHFVLSGVPRVAAPEKPLRFDVTTTTALAFLRTRRQADAWITGHVLDGQMESLRVPAPAGYEVVAVDGLPDLGWDVRDGELVLSFPGPAPAEWTLHVSLAADGADESAVPLLLPVGATRSFVATKAEARGGGLLERADEGAGRSAEPKEQERLPKPFRDRVGEPLVVAAGAPAPRWRVTWPAEVEVLGAQVDRLLVDALVGEHGRAYYQIWAVVRANGAPSLELTLPAGARLVEGRREGVVTRLGQRGSSRVTPLVSRDEAQILFWTAEIDLPWPAGDGGRLEIPMPAMSSPVSTVEVRAGVSRAFRYEWADPSRRGAVGPPPFPRQARAESNELGRQILAKSYQAARVDATQGFQLLPAGFQGLEASWSALDPSPSPLVLTVRRLEEARR